VATTSALFFIERGDVVAGIALFSISNIGFNGGMHFYNSFLIDISTKKNIGRISGYGWALGYVGGLVSLALVYPLIKGGLGDGNLALYRLSFPVTGAFFLVASIPSFIYLRERDGGRKGAGIKDGLRRLSATFHEMKRFRELVKYFFCYLVYTDAVNTVIVFSAVFATKVLGFTPSELVIYFLITQVTAAGGALVFGPVTDRLGARGTISITLVIWTGVAVAACLVRTKAEFYMIGLAAGAVLGANQSASRAMLGLFTPHGRNAEFFGFFSLVGKFAAVAGPVLYGEVAARTGSHRPAVLMLGAFFIAGLVGLQFVNEKEGVRAAEEYESEAL